MQYSTTDDLKQAFDAQFEYSIDTNGLNPMTSTCKCTVTVGCWTTDCF